MDTLRADHLSAYGYERQTSPNIDRLAREGTLFTNAYASSSWTVPSHMTMFTSLPPTLHGVQRIRDRLDPARITLAQRFREAGYRTAGFVSGPTLHPAFGFERGFDLYDTSTASIRNIDDTSNTFFDRQRSHHAVTGPPTAAAVRHWLGQDAEPPFFLFVHLWDPHYDYIPPPPYDTRFDPDYDGGFDFSDVERNPSINAQMLTRDLDHLIALYDGEIAATDAVIGELVAALEERGWLADTLIVLTSDHGEEFFEHGKKGHRKTLFEEVLRVPLVFRLPGTVAAGRRIDTLIDAVHLMPTILGLVGLEPGPEARGRNLAPVLQGAAAPNDLRAFAELRHFASDRPLYMLRVGDRKYVGAARGDEDPDADIVSNIVYYDLASDPQERQPLKPMDNDARQSAAELRDAIRGLVTSADALPREGIPATPLDDATERQLRALGYLTE